MTPCANSSAHHPKRCILITPHRRYACPRAVGGPEIPETQVRHRLLARLAEKRLCAAAGEQKHAFEQAGKQPHPVDCVNSRRVSVNRPAPFADVLLRGLQARVPVDGAARLRRQREHALRGGCPNLRQDSPTDSSASTVQVWANLASLPHPNLLPAPICRPAQAFLSAARRFGLFFGLECFRVQIVLQYMCNDPTGNPNLRDGTPDDVQVSDACAACNLTRGVRARDVARWLGCTSAARTM